MSLAVVIVSYNSADYLTPCIESVYGQAGGVPLDVIVVDNESTDGSVALLEERFPTVKVIKSPNRGFAHANNLGFAASEAPFVLFLNPDTEIRSGTFADLLDVFRVRPDVGLVGCRQVTTDGELCASIRRFPTPARNILEAFGSERFPVRATWMGERELDPGAYDRETSCDWVSGSFMLARREAVTAAGGMDERYFLFAEDPDLGAGVKAGGWQVCHSPAMTIVHHGGDNSENVRLEAQRAYSRRQYMFKHQDRVTRSLCTVGLMLFYARRSVGPASSHRGDLTAKRSAARAALKTLLGRTPPPFGELSGPLRGPRVWPQAADS